MAATAYGVRFGVRVSEEGALRLLTERLPPGWRRASSTSVDRIFSLVVGGEGHGRGLRRLSLLYAEASCVARSRDLEHALERFESALQLYVAEHSPRRVFVHAGVVGWRGRAVVIPGRSMSGKTTLVSELVRAGAVYYSDEYAVFDSRGLVHPYARPLAVREGGGPRQTRRPVESFGGHAGRGALAVGLVLASRYERGARWRPRPLSAGEAVLEMLSHTVPARAGPRRALSALSKAAAAASVALAGERGEAARVAGAILGMLGE